MHPLVLTLVFVTCQAFLVTPTRKSFAIFSSSEAAPTPGEEVVVDLEKLSQESASEAALPKFEYTSSSNVVRVAPRQAGWFPLLLAPKQLDGTYAGDVGFDPLNLSEGRGRITYLREAEVKHARLAMLAAAGWPMSELWHKEIASSLGLDSILAAADKAPSVLNGGLANEWIYAAAAFSLALGSALELKGLEMSQKEGHKPGDYGFDPLGLYSFRGSFGIDRIAEKISREEKLARAKFDMEVAEIKNGRVAMLGITGMCLQELASGIPVVQQTPFFFGDPIL